MIAAIEAAGGAEVRYTEVEGAGHDVWDVAYRDAEFAAFLVGELVTDVFVGDTLVTVDTGLASLHGAQMLFPGAWSLEFGIH